jgi:hypothetical protein
MNKQTRIQKISHIIETTKEPHGKQDVLWHGSLHPMNAYEIPLEYLVYNKYNGRILSRTKTLESQGKLIDPETEQGKKVIEDLLWESKVSRNEITLKDIKEKEQLKVGIITKDGIVIDGNRRVMLLNRLKKSHFRAIVLPVALEDDPIEVERLETTYQMGEDEKLGYNPIEKYLKAKELYKKLINNFSPAKSVEQIADWMGESAPQIKEWLSVVSVIDEYLEYVQYNGIYAMADTHNDGKEDLFLFLRKWIETFYDKESQKGFDNYSNLDVDDLKRICFDYIRAKIGKSYDGKDFRHIADGNRPNHFFGSKKVWENFSSRHFQNVDAAIQKIDEENPIDYDSEKIEAALCHRDKSFRDLVLEGLTNNIDEHRTILGFNKAANKPAELVGNAKKAIEAINPNHETFSTPEVLNQVEDLIQKLLKLVKKKSPEHTLSIVAELLESVKLDAPNTDKEKLLVQLKSVQKIAYQKEKNLKAH